MTGSRYAASGGHPRNQASALRMLAYAARAIGRLFRAGLALALLLALIVGIPYGLVRYIGWPLPDHVPTWNEVQIVLLSPMTPEFLLGFLACVLWPLWARFTFDVFAAIPDMIRVAEWPHPVRGGPLHAAAGVLVGAVVFSILGSRVSHLSMTTQIAASGLAGESPPPAVTAIRQPTDEIADEHRVAILTSLHTNVATSPIGEQSTEIVRYPAQGVYDSLWRIAERRLGDGTRWPEIWALNKGTTQVDGRVFTKPSLIHPGWKLRLPVPAAHKLAPPADTQPDPSAPPPGHDTDTQQDAPTTQAPTSEAPAPDTPPASVDAERPVPNAESETGIWTSTGAFVGIGLAALITVALITVRLYRRRCYRPDADESDDPGVTPVVRALRIAHDVVTLPSDGGSPIAPALPASAGGADLDLRDRAQATVRTVLPDSDETIVGVHDGHAVALDVARTRGLGLTGPGAHAGARALIVTLLAHAVGNALVVMPAADARALFGADLPPRLPTRLRIVDDLAAALGSLDAELLGRIRDADESDVDSSSPQHDALAPLVLVATPTAGTERRIQSILDNGSTVAVAGIVLGQWRPGGTARVRDDGIIGATSPNLAEQLAGARLFSLPGTDATDLLALLHDAESAHEPPAVVEPKEQPRNEPSATPHDVYDFVTPDTAESKPNIAPRNWAPTTTVMIDIPARIETAHHHEPDVSSTPSRRIDTPSQEESQSPALPEAVNGEPQSATAAGSPVVPPRPSVPTTAHAGARVAVPDAPALHLQVLGRQHLTHLVEVSTDVIDAVAPRQREILVYLALHRNGCRRESLTTALWPDAPGDRPYNSFHATLSQLRRALRKATRDAISTLVVNEGGHYRLDPSLVTVDLWQVQDALAARRQAPTPQEKTAALRRVAELYRGDLAEGIAADWIETSREALRRDVLDALSALIRTVDNDPEQMLALLEQARAMDPYNEAIYRDLMRVQASHGQYDSIPRTLGLLTTSLAELDQRPTHDTLQLADLLGRPRGDHQRSRAAS